MHRRGECSRRNENHVAAKRGQKIAGPVTSWSLPCKIVQSALAGEEHQSSRVVRAMQLHYHPVPWVGGAIGRTWVRDSDAVSRACAGQGTKRRNPRAPTMRMVQLTLCSRAIWRSRWPAIGRGLVELAKDGQTQRALQGNAMDGIMRR